MIINKVKMVISERVEVDEIKFRCSEDVAESEWFKNLFNEDKEIFVCIHLNVKNQIKSFEIVSMGSMTSSIVHPREVLRGAILSGAISVIFAHNHPSGDPEPSIDDIEITNRLCRAFNLVGINVLDHIILSDGGFFSFLIKDMISRDISFS
jgi:DNA repair protein RadC